MITDFFLQHGTPRLPLCLGLSGGPDSMALFLSLLELNIPFHVAHVDHRWRKESEAEATHLEDLAERFKIPFHKKVLDPADLLTGNLEDASRRCRLAFFGDLAKKYNFQAVILGHHADDQAETVLKRVLEGASLTKLCGMREISQIDDLVIWRPLLKVSKKEILLWLHQKDIAYFEDPTNRDPKYLRGKMRTQILPQLENDFGKQVQGSLCRIGREAQELQHYLEAKIAPQLHKKMRGPFGVMIDIDVRECSHPFELKALLKAFSEDEGLLLSHQALETAVDLVAKGVAHKAISAGKEKKSELLIDRSRVFILYKDFEKLPEKPIALTPGIHKYGPWTVSVEPYRSEDLSKPTSWIDLWQGNGYVFLPEGNYTMAPPNVSAPFPRSSPLKKWWTHHKVPAFLRAHIPVIQTGDSDRICCEFLSGRTPHTSTSPLKWKIEMEKPD